jgi:HEAT repeat protein
MAAMGAADQITQVIKTEKDPAVRLQAIRSLGNAKNERSSQTLVDLYGSEQDRDTRKAIIAALASQGNADGLVALARKESNNDLKLEMVRRLSDMAPKNKAAMDYLMELVR